jgi:hypothetical protein
MKVKGWVVMANDCSKNEMIWDFRYDKKEALKSKEKNQKKYSILFFKVKPCTITIHDKAVKG